MGTSEQSNNNYKHQQQAKALAELSVVELLKRGFREEAKERIDELNQQLAESKRQEQATAEVSDTLCGEIVAKDARIAGLVLVLCKVKGHLEAMGHVSGNCGTYAMKVVDLITTALTASEPKSPWTTIVPGDDSTLPKSTKARYLVLNHVGTMSLVIGCDKKLWLFAYTRWMPIPPPPEQE
jgi:hypothetical protein